MNVDGFEIEPLPVYRGGKVVGYAYIDSEDLPLVGGRRLKIDEEGYIYVRIKRKDKTLHRLVMGVPKGMLVDHIFGRLHDCRKSQLRVTDAVGNGQNRVKLSRSNKSGYRGVYFDASTGIKSFV